MRWIATILCCLCGALPLAAQETSLPEDIYPQLKVLIEAARQHSPSLQATKFGVDEAQANVGVADAQGRVHVTSYVRIDASYEHRFSSDAILPNPFQVAPTASVVATQPLYHWGEIEAQREVARLRGRLARAGVTQKRLDVAQDVRRYFLNLQIARMGAQIAQENIDYADRSLEGQEALAQQGRASERTLLEKRIYRSEREEDLLNARKGERFYTALLRELTGISDLKIDPVDLGSITVMPDDQLDALQRRAANGGEGPEQLTLEGQLAVERASAAALNARNRPKLDLVAATALDSIDEYSSRGEYRRVPRAMGYLGLQASWNFWDSGETKSLKLASLARQHRLSAQLDEARLRRVRDAEQLAEGAALAAQQIETRSSRVNLLTRALDLLQNEAQNNVVGGNELLQRRIELEQTRVNLLQAKVDYLLAVAGLYSATTTPPGQDAD